MDNLYSASSKEKELKIEKFFFGNSNPLDEYFWSGFDSSVIYSIFPESKITLPKDLSFRIKHFKA